MCVCVHVCVFMPVCVCVCVYVCNTRYMTESITLKAEERGGREAVRDQD